MEIVSPSTRPVRRDPRPASLFTSAGLLLPLACGAGLLSGCQEPDPAEALFRERVLPALEQRCGSTTCHGVAPDAEARGETIHWDRFFFRIDADGHAADPAQAYTVARRYINTVEDPAFSSLLRKPLAVGFGGMPHYGQANFDSPDDPVYQVIYDWIGLERSGGEDPEPLNELEHIFAETVQPVLVNGTCMTSACHGPTAGAIPYALDAGYRGAFPIAATRHNYQESRRQLSLDGFPGQSRLLRKSQPLHTTGIAHRGTNFDFYAHEPGGGLEAILAWVCAERQARTGHPCLEAGEPPISGFVFLQGPLEPHHPFDLDVFTPGRDIILASVADERLEPVTLENLTASLHDGSVDIRDLSVSPDGEEVLFAMRTGLEEGHHLYRLDLATRQVDQLTFGNGPLSGGGLATDRDPTWGPDGSIWFVSTRAGQLDDTGQRLDADLYSLELETGELRRWTSSPHSERKATFFNVGPHAGEVSVTVLRAAIPAQARAQPFRFPPDLSKEYHQHFGTTPAERLFFDMRELADGRYVATLGDLTGVWQAGQLGVIDRNMGPMIDPDGSSPPAVADYLPPLVRLDPDAASTGVTDGAWRDAVPLPDGRILAAYTSARFDLADPEVSPVFRLELLTLEEALDGSGPMLAERRVLVELPGVSLSDPEPIYVRAPVRLHGPAHQPAAGVETGLFYHSGLPMVDALLTHLPPTGEKVPRADIQGVRLVEALPFTPGERRAIPPEETRHGLAGATTTGLSALSPARVLAEMPLAADGSFQVEVPAGVPFRLQGIDAFGMAVGTMHNRWYTLEPGQTIRQGISAANGVARYETACGACHGKADGSDDPPQLEEPDMMTSASFTLSRFDRQDPRRPVAAPVAGETTRRTVDFQADVQPVLTARCAEGCHAGAEPEGGLSLTGAPTRWFTDAYESLLEPGDGSGGGFEYVDAGSGRSRGSFLAEMLTGLELEAPRALAAPGVAHPTEFGAPPLSDEELKAILLWIDLGASYQGR